MTFNGNTTNNGNNNLTGASGNNSALNSNQAFGKPAEGPAALKPIKQHPSLAISLPDDAPSTMRELVLSYLVFNCYEETAKSFARAIFHGKSSSVVANGATTSVSQQGEPASTTRRLNKLGNSWDSILPEMEPSIASNSHSTRRQESFISAFSSGSATTTASIVADPGRRRKSSLKSHHVEMHPSHQQTSSSTDSLEDVEMMTSSPSNSTPLKLVEGKADMVAAISSLSQRKQILHHVRSGDIQSAAALCRVSFPSVLATTTNDDSTLDSAKVSFMIDSQYFIELVRSHRQTDALLFGQEVLQKYLRFDSPFAAMMRDISSLLAYQHPENSPLSSLLNQERRETVASIINSAIMASLKQSPMAAIELIAQQTTLVMDQLSNIQQSITKDRHKSSSKTQLAHLQDKHGKSWRLRDLLDAKPQVMSSSSRHSSQTSMVL